MYTRALVFILMCTALAAGCTATEPQVATVPVLTLQAPSTARVGDSVELILQVSNSSTSPLTLVLSYGPEFSFDPLVREPDGQQVWRRWNGLWAGPTIGPTIVLAPGQAATFRAVWDLRDVSGEFVAPGEYFVEAQFHVKGVPTLQARPHRITVVR